MDYILSEVNEKLKQFSDKMGSDYFPLPVLLNYFESATYDFVGERLTQVEKTQTITDDIRNLLKTSFVPIIISPYLSVDISNPPTQTRFIAGIPTDYLRLISYSVFYKDGYEARRVDLLTHAQYNLYKNNPNRKPTKRYPIILIEDNLFEIDSGNEVPEKLKLRYAKKPIFATTGEPNKRIVNLPNDAIEKILLITIKSLFNKTGDQRIQYTDKIENTYRKIFK